MQRGTDGGCCAVSPAERGPSDSILPSWAANREEGPSIGGGSTELEFTHCPEALTYAGGRLIPWPRSAGPGALRADGRGRVAACIGWPCLNGWTKEMGGPL